MFNPLTVMGFFQTSTACILAYSHQQQKFIKKTLICAVLGDFDHIRYANLCMGDITFLEGTANVQLCSKASETKPSSQSEVILLFQMVRLLVFPFNALQSNALSVLEWSKVIYR